MTYNTPQLFLIGAAQNLVLGNDTSDVGPCKKSDDSPSLSSDSIENW